MGNRPSVLARLDPRPHQLEAIDAVCDEFQIADRATVIKACGTGKTLLEPEIDASLHARYTLVFAPTLPDLSSMYSRRNGNRRDGNSRTFAKQTVT